MFEKNLQTAKYTVKLSVSSVLSVVFLRGIAPHILQFIETAIFGQHDVDDYIHIIDQDPLIGLSAFVFIGKFITSPFDLLFHRIGYGLYLGGTGCLTDDKEIRYAFRDLS